jgi:hypothetical protein
MRFLDRNCFSGYRGAYLALSKSFPVGWQIDWRRFDTEGQLLVLLPDCDLHIGEHPADDCKLAISALRKFIPPVWMQGFASFYSWRIPSGETLTFGIESIQGEPSGATH